MADDISPQQLDPDTAPEIVSPLARFGGERPPAPAWFHEALAKAPERTHVPVLGVDIELLTWGERGKAGLLFVHGNSAHADWWSFIAPFFAADYRVAALSLSGMGASGWRDRYTVQTYAAEIFECARAGGLYDAPMKPVFVGHSFGGAQTFYSAARHPERMRAAILVDTGFGGPPTPEELEQWRQEEIAAGRTPPLMRATTLRGWGSRVYPSREAALTRFRLMPPQIPGKLFVADHIARTSLRPAPMADGSGEGWTWRFDPGLWTKLDRSGMEGVDPQAMTTPLVHIYGDRSEIIRPHGLGSWRKQLIPASVPKIVIPDCAHHVMVDQPLALVSALRAVLATWPA